MEKTNQFALNDERILVCLLSHLPDFRTLSSVLKSADDFRVIYESHSQTIRHAVAYNLVGPALPQALRCVRHSDAHSEHPFTISPEGQQEDELAAITEPEIRRLVQNASVVSELEGLFSLSHKLFQNPPGETSERQLYARMDFMRAFTSEELLQLHSTSQFLLELADHAFLRDDMDEYESDFGTVVDAVSPLEPDMAPDMDDIDEHPLLMGYLSSPLFALLHERGVPLPPTGFSNSDSSHWHSILDSVEGDKDQCVHCHEIVGFDLLGPSTYAYLTRNMRSDPDGDDPSDLLRDGLRYNLIETQHFRQQISSLEPEDVIPNLIEEILAFGKQPGFENVKVGDWLCAKCVDELLKAHLPFWLLDKKRKGASSATPSWNYEH
ncbi:hypothetical protein VNI00_014961 [Paramarasmius palmivorus]|uniref:Uncharacterized protein n=1 Tax=Paramarasmius palmivorus TaxID=297713 RepID=A0AAW0BP17_9AGAR